MLTREQFQRLSAKFPTQQNRELFRRSREFYRSNPKSSSDEVFDTHRLCRCSSLSDAVTKNVRSAGGNQYAPIVIAFVRRCRSQHSGGLKCAGCERLSKSLDPARRWLRPRRRHRYICPHFLRSVEQTARADGLR